MSIMLLNQDIINYIQNFTNIKYLLATTKQYNSIKENIFLWKLNWKYSEKYVFDEHFRNLIRITNIRQIYTLNLSSCFYIKSCALFYS